MKSKFMKSKFMKSKITAAIEARQRRRYAKLGLRLVKTPSRSWLKAYYGPGYMVLDGNTVINGCIRREYDLSLKEVVEYADTLEATA